MKSVEQLSYQLVDVKEDSTAINSIKRESENWSEFPFYSLQKFEMLRNIEELYVVQICQRETTLRTVFCAFSWKNLKLGLKERTKFIVKKCDTTICHTIFLLISSTSFCLFANETIKNITISCCQMMEFVWTLLLDKLSKLGSDLS